MAARTLMILYRDPMPKSYSRAAVGVNLTAPGASLSTSPLIFCSTASAVFFEILLLQNKAMYISSGLRMVSYIFTRYEDHISQLPAMEGLLSSCIISLFFQVSV